MIKRLNTYKKEEKVSYDGYLKIIAVKETHHAGRFPGIERRQKPGMAERIAQQAQRQGKERPAPRQNARKGAPGKDPGLPGGQRGLERRDGRPGGEALPGLLHPVLRFRLPGEHQYPRVHQVDREKRFLGGGQETEGDQCPARRLRPGLSAGDPVRGQLRLPENEKAAGGHRLSGTVRLGLRAPGRQRLRPGIEKQKPGAGGGHRFRAGQPDLCRADGQTRISGDRFRSPARTGRRFELRHPRVPLAQEHRPLGDRLPGSARRGL